MSPLYSIHPITDIPAQITSGEDPWFALGGFLHDWWHYAIEQRHQLIDTPPPLSDTFTERQWAAFCAAAVEESCQRTSFPTPTWVYQPIYILDNPWLLSSEPSQREWLLTTSLAPFQRHNVFVGATILDNKYEIQPRAHVKPRWQIWSDEELKQYQNRAHSS